jgi:putative transposase
MNFDPKIHHRKSIRLKGYDYSQAGLYFITICCQNRSHLFGEIHKPGPRAPSEMLLNEAGQMIEKWYFELEHKFPDMRCHEMIVMPNHMHFIIENMGAASVGADLCVRPHKSTAPDLSISDLSEMDKSEMNILGEHIGSPLHAVVQWFKTMTTNAYIRGVKNLGWPPFDQKIWQRNYWEHIIRHENAYANISNYIINNPAQWPTDILNKL